MTTESKQQVAREAREDIHHTCVTVAKSGAYAILDCDRTDAIILSAIERATEHLHQLLYLGQAAQPQRSDSPQRSEQHEWTNDDGYLYEGKTCIGRAFDEHDAKRIKATHNTTIAAERNNVKCLAATCKDLRNGLAAERQRREQAEQQILNREQRWEEREPLVKALNLLLDAIDYLAGNCKVNDMVGAVLDAVVIRKVRDALAKVKVGK